MKSAVIVDSTAYLSEEWLAQHPHVYQIDLSVTFHNGDVFCDTSNPQLLHDFYTRLKNEAQLPTTSQPQPGEYMALLDQLVAQGYETIYCIHLSSQISGTYQTACMLMEDYQDRLKTYVIDSGSSCMVMAELVQRALTWFEAGVEPDVIYQRLVWSAEHADIYLMVEDLNNLAKGGRLSSASALLGGLLQIRPLLHFDQGQIVLSEKIRTTKKVLKRMVDLIEEWEMRYPQGVAIGIGNIEAREEMQLLVEMIAERYPNLEVRQSQIGPVVGTHTGIGTKGIGIIPLVPTK